MELPQPDRMSGDAAACHVRHKSEQTLFYQLSEQYWPEFQTQLTESDRFLQRHVTCELDNNSHEILMSLRSDSYIM